MFTQTKRDKPHVATLQLDCIPRNLVTHEYKTTMPSMQQIINFVGSRPFRSKVNLTDRYHNIRIHSETVIDSTFSCHMGKYDSRVMQQDHCNVPATIMRAMNMLFRNIKNLMISLHDILIANYTDKEHVYTIRAGMKIAKDSKLWSNKNKCQFIAVKMQIL